MRINGQEIKPGRFDDINEINGCKLLANMGNYVVCEWGLSLRFVVWKVLSDGTCVNGFYTDDFMDAFLNMSKRQKD
jgi:hypothetical protein